jgi:hypothetical protein
MKSGFAQRSMFLFCLCVVILILLTLAESALGVMSLAFQRVITFPGFVLPELDVCLA